MKWWRQWRQHRRDLKAGWKCQVCGKQRPDLNISVVYVPMAGMERAYPETRWNVRYCNDRPKCFVGARLMR